MAPDADKLRQRKAAVVEDEANANGHQQVTNGQRLCSLASLKTTEVCIDGLIYDISNFDHPGGDQIQLFGGNDVTIQYNMIHPYHTSKHLEKMTLVGKVSDFTCEYVLRPSSSCPSSPDSILRHRSFSRELALFLANSLSLSHA